MKKNLSLVFFFSLAMNTLLAQSPSLRINEVSNGTGGSKEYVELIVIGQPSSGCNPQTLDLRGWILDDNNGRFATGSGKGIANGALRFAANSLWSAVPVGTLILIYNNEDYDATIIPAQDLSLTDGNCRIVLPVNSTLLEKNSEPTQANSNYPSTGWTAGGDWNTVGLANGDDSFQIYAPTNTTVPVHAVSYGNNSSNNIIYFSGSGATKVFSCMNTTSTDFSLQSNWTSADANTAQTPGLPNSTQNAAYINSLNPTCSNVATSFSVTVAPTNVSCNATCNGTATPTMNGGQAPFTYAWSNGQTSETLSNLCTGNYDVAVTDANGCEASTTFTISNDAGITLTTTPNQTICAGESVTLTASGTTTYLWDNNLGPNASISVQPTTTTTYEVTGTTNGCSDTKTITVTVNPLPSVNAGEDITSCDGLDITLTATGATTYQWDQNVINGQSFDLTNGTYTYTVTGTTNGCSATDQVTIKVIDCTQQLPDTISILNFPNVFTPNGDQYNDVFEPVQMTGVSIQDFSILNRWGNEIFHSTDPTTISWDGKSKDGNEATEGVYFYYITYHDITGTSKKQQGFVHLIRTKS